MPKRTWTPEKIWILFQGKKDGRSIAQIAQALGKSKNEVNCSWNNYVRRRTWSWEEIKRTVHGT
jgi:hypothetical protein